MNGEPFCSDVSREEGAPLAGTASRAELWLLVEHRGAWSSDAVVDNDLAPAVQAWLAGQLAALGAVGKARALFVRQEPVAESRPADLRRCFLAVSREQRQELYGFAVEALDELPMLDLAAGLAADALDAHRSPSGLTLVCGNGRRDRCCARRGVPVYHAVAGLDGEAAWLSTHQGGHRYAATGLWLPEGVAYGYLTPADASPLAAARARGALHLPRFRGRTFHPAPVQAADALVRAELGVEALDAWSLEAFARVEELTWTVVLAGPAGRVECVVEARRETVLAGCAPANRKESERFALRSWSRT